VLDEIARKYDLALIDLPPLTPSAADAAALCDWSQGTIVVVRANATRASTLARAVEMIDSNKVLGVVLNQEQDDMPRWLQRLLRLNACRSHLVVALLSLSWRWA
jgi:Mrp family chromosome partitioning ATPase